MLRISKDDSKEIQEKIQRNVDSLRELAEFGLWVLRQYGTKCSF